MCLTNYKEPTGRDWAAFSGLTFDCSVNGRMKTFKSCLRKRQICSRKLTSGSNCNVDKFITLLTPFIAFCTRVTISSLSTESTQPHFQTHWDWEKTLNKNRSERLARENVKKQKTDCWTEKIIMFMNAMPVTTEYGAVTRFITWSLNNAL